MITRKLTCLIMKPEDDLSEYEEYDKLKKSGYFKKRVNKISSNHQFKL